MWSFKEFLRARQGLLVTVRYGGALSLFVLITLTSCTEPSPEVTDQISAQAYDERPNVLLIVVDDMGFNDLGITGSEIATPNMDHLAANGVLMSNFHVAPNCSPTRAMLMSGMDNHLVGLGNMAEEMAPNQEGRPGYEGHLNLRAAALPEVMQDAGYKTYMTGKWHLGLSEETSPAARGFDRSFAMLQGGAGAFSNMLPIVGPEPARYRRDGQTVRELPADFYSTAAYTDEMIRYIEEGRDDERPFFAYLAYTAPHWPLQAPQASIEKYRGRYDAGYDQLRRERFAALQRLGFVDPGVEPFPAFPGQPRWHELTAEEQRVAARKMEVYAAMVDDLDLYLGRLLLYLKELGEYDNTFIFLLSDNGPEAHELEVGWDALTDWVEQCCDNSLANIGKADSYVWYGHNWGQSGNTPLRLYKGYTAQGGVRAPAIAQFPGRLETGARQGAVVSVMDVMPTVLEVAGVSAPSGTFRGREVLPMQGRSLMPMLRGEAATAHPPDYAIGWELFGKRALRQGDWKIIYRPVHELYETVPDSILGGRWQLYNLRTDPAELHDLSAAHPQRLRELVALWDDYAERNGVILPDFLSGY